MYKNINDSDVYLGGGLSASFNGYHIVLKTSSHEGVNNEIYIDEPTLIRFLRYVETLNYFSLIDNKKQENR